MSILIEHSLPKIYNSCRSRCMDTYTVAGLELGFFQYNFWAKISHILLNRNSNLRIQTTVSLPTEKLRKPQEEPEQTKNLQIFQIQKFDFPAPTKMLRWALSVREQSLQRWRIRSSLKKSIRAHSAEKRKAGMWMWREGCWTKLNSD